MEHVTTDQPAASPRRNERTCVGCGRRDAPAHLVRLVASADGSVAADFRGGHAGRGAHVHPAADCLGKAAKRGLARSFRRQVRVDRDALAVAIARAAHARLGELLTSALASGQVVSEPAQILDELRRGALALVVVAVDTPADVLQGELGKAIVEGKAVSWGTCASFGTLARREPVAVLGIRSSRLGEAIAQACRVADGVRTGAEVR